MSQNVISLRFENDPAQVLRSRLGRTLRGVPQACAGAVNDATRDQVTQLRAEVGAVAKFKPGDLRTRIAAIKAAPSLNPVGGIAVSKGRLPLSYFEARQEQGGVSYQILTAGGRHFIPGGIIGRRTGDVYRPVAGPRTPLIKLRGPSPFYSMAKSGLIEKTSAELSARILGNVTTRLAKLVESWSGAP